MAQADVNPNAHENEAERIAKKFGHDLVGWRSLPGKKGRTASCQKEGCLAIVFVDVSGSDIRGTAIWFDCPMT